MLRTSSENSPPGGWHFRLAWNKNKRQPSQKQIIKTQGSWSGTDTVARLNTGITAS